MPDHELGEHGVERVVLARERLGRSQAHVDVGQARAARSDQLRSERAAVSAERPS